MPPSTAPAEKRRFAGCRWRWMVSSPLPSSLGRMFMGAEQAYSAQRISACARFQSYLYSALAGPCALISPARFGVRVQRSKNHGSNRLVEAQEHKGIIQPLMGKSLPATNTGLSFCWIWTSKNPPTVLLLRPGSRNSQIVSLKVLAQMAAETIAIIRMIGFFA